MRNVKITSTLKVNDQKCSGVHSARASFWLCFGYALLRLTYYPILRIVVTVVTGTFMKWNEWSEPRGGVCESQRTVVSVIPFHDVT